ncbi:MAG: beta-lactamase family protein [Chitinophagaceae bacterium]|nr:beta-lactamase family protein [Chitinophagaceae bacterium]
MKFVVAGLLILQCLIASAQQSVLQRKLDSLRQAGNFPGLSVAIIIDNKPVLPLVSGFNDIEENLVLKTTDRFMQGSVGKTYASAIAIDLIKRKKISLDDKVSMYLGSYPWFDKIPNAADITIQMLMNHTSGVMRYEFNPNFLKDLTAQPDKEWKPAELLNYILEQKASFEAGKGWEYSDTNYILLGMIIEAVTGKTFYRLVKQQLLDKWELSNTFPSDRRRLPGLSQGYAGPENEFGGKEKVVGEDGLFIINPQFEWTGGGIYSTTSDLATWGHYLYGGQVIDTTLLLALPVAAKLGRDTKYAQGVIIRPTSLGTAYGHSGFFPGYMTELLHFPNSRMTIAVQTNSSNFKNLKLGLMRVLLIMATEALNQSKQ